MVGAASAVPQQASRPANRIDLMSDFSKPIVQATGLTKVVQLNENAANGSAGPNEVGIFQDISLQGMPGAAGGLGGGPGAGKYKPLRPPAGLDTPRASARPPD